MFWTSQYDFLEIRWILGKVSVTITLKHDNMWPVGLQLNLNKTGIYNFFFFKNLVLCLLLKEKLGKLFQVPLTWP